MRTVTGWLVWICLPLLSFGSSAYAHAATPAKPVLDGMTAMQLSLGVLRPTLGDGVVGAMNFETTNRVRATYVRKGL